MKMSQQEPAFSNSCDIIISKALKELLETRLKRLERETKSKLDFLLRAKGYLNDIPSVLLSIKHNISNLAEQEAQPYRKKSIPISNGMTKCLSQTYMNVNSATERKLTEKRRPSSSRSRVSENEYDSKIKKTSSKGIIHQQPMKFGPIDKNYLQSLFNDEFPYTRNKTQKDLTRACPSRKALESRTVSTSRQQADIPKKTLTKSEKAMLTSTSNIKLDRSGFLNNSESLQIEEHSECTNKLKTQAGAKSKHRQSVVKSRQGIPQPPTSKKLNKYNSCADVKSDQAKIPSYKKPLKIPPSTSMKNMKSLQTQSQQPQTQPHERRKMTGSVSKPDQPGAVAKQTTRKKTPFRSEKPQLAVNVPNGNPTPRDAKLSKERQQRSIDKFYNVKRIDKTICKAKSPNMSRNADNSNSMTVEEIAERNQALSQSRLNSSLGDLDPNRTFSINMSRDGLNLSENVGRITEEDQRDLKEDIAQTERQKFPLSKDYFEFTKTPAFIRTVFDMILKSEFFSIESYMMINLSKDSRSHLLKSFLEEQRQELLKDLEFYSKRQEALIKV